MGEFLRVFLDSITFLWPFARVDPWERGLYVILGRWTFEVGPGVYFFIPWFSRVATCTTVLALVKTERQDITLTDGTPLTFAATANVRVSSVRDAYLGVDSYHQTTQETIAAVLAQKLSEVAAERVTADKRGRLLSDLLRWVNAETNVYGVQVEALRFTTFVVGARTFRLLQESGVPPSW